MLASEASGVFFSAVASAWLPIAFDAAIKSFVVLGLACFLAWRLRHRSAAARHLVWFLALASLAALPILSAALPGWNVLPGWTALAPDDLVQIRPALDVPEPRTVAYQPPTPGPIEPGPPPTDIQQATADRKPTPLADFVGTEDEPIAAPSAAVEPLSGSAETEAAGPSPRWTWQPWCFLAWAAGTAFALMRVGLAVASLEWVERRADRVAGGRLASVLVELSAEMGVTRKVTLLLSDRRSMPMQWGTLRPRLLLPASAERWAADRLRVVLLHELAHVRRWDCLAQLITQLVGAAFWFHPLVWVARREMQRAGEAAADDLTLKTGFRPSDYAEHVLQIASGFRADRVPAWGAIAMAGPSRLEGRLLAILDPKRDRRNVSRLIILGLLMAASVTVVPLAMLRAAPEQNPQRDRAEAFIQLLKEHRYETAAKMFDPTLVEVLPPKELERFWREFDGRRAGAFQGPISYEHQQFPGGRLLAVRCRWAKAVMVIRLVFDTENRIAGFWLARDREGPTPEHFRKGGYMFGPATERIAGLDHTLRAGVVGVDGKPLESAVLALWTAADASNRDKRTWTDPDTGRRWKRAECGVGAGWTDGRFTWRRLAPGTYLVTAQLGHSVTLPLGLSESVRLDQTRKNGTVTVKMVPGPSLTVHTIDADTGEPLAGVWISLKRDDGRRPKHVTAGAKSEGTVRSEHLPPGTYTLSAGKSSRHPLTPRYVTEQETIDVEITGGEDREMTLSLKATPLSQEEIDKRWPWIAVGTVTDGEGNPMEGVEIWAYAGFLLQGPSGTATTDSQGHYTLRYANGGLHRTDIPRDKVLLQTAFSSTKDGYVEANLNRHARVIAARREPEEENWREKHGFKPPDERPLVLPGKPHRVDFVMVPEVTITGRLVDGGGRPIANRNLRITDMPSEPEHAGLRGLATDEDGRFSVDKTPPRWTWWFTLSPFDVKQPIQSPPFQFQRSGEYEIFLRLVHDDAAGTESIQLVSVRYAKAAARVAEVEVRAAEDANRRVPVTVPPAELNRMRLSHRLAALDVERAQAVQKGDVEALGEINVRRAKAVADVAEAELHQAEDANRRYPGTVPPAELRRMALSYRLATLDIERAQAVQKGDEKALREIDVRRAKAAADVAEAELLAAEDANRRYPGTVTPAELKRISGVLRGATRDIERAEAALGELEE